MGAHSNKCGILATSVLKINKDRFWALFLNGGKIQNNEIPKDEIARQAWINVGLSPSRIVSLGVRDNYWLQGNGFNLALKMFEKAGPNTELFYNEGSDRIFEINSLPPDANVEDF